MIGANRADLAARDAQRCLDNLVADQRAAALDRKLGHDAALRRLACGRAEPPAASYLARKSSIPSLRKSGKARRNVSWFQSHHASEASRLVMSSGNRRLIERAGLPATIV